MHRNVQRRDEEASAMAMLRRLRRQHVLWAAVAAVLSVILHVGLALRFPGIVFYGFIRTPAEQEVPSFRVETLRDEPRTELERPARWSATDAERAATTAREMAEDAQPLRRETDEARLEPRAVQSSMLAGATHSLAEPPERPDREAWDARPEIIQIERRICDEGVAALPRRLIAATPRLAGMGDVFPPAERDQPATGLSQAFPPAPEVDADLIGFGAPSYVGGPAGFPYTQSVPEEAPQAAAEKREDVSPYRPVERLLRVDVETYRPFAEDHAYARIRISRWSPESLPVLPKDIVFVQDCSASMTERRMHFCRNGLSSALNLLQRGDRFEVVGFRDATEWCFGGWRDVDEASLEEAWEFIQGFQAEGQTDIYASMRELLALERAPQRALISLLISDGVPTAGMTDSARIIESFSAENRGALSVFTLGTHRGVNAYLLDLLSYRNRGDVFVVQSGRWDIPAAVVERVREVNRPVLKDVRFAFAGWEEAEALPRQTANLYLDRPLVVYCRYPRDFNRLIFQAVGQGAEAACDMVFDVDLSQAIRGSKELRSIWAWQKIYDLMGEHTRTRDPALVKEAQKVAREYGLRVPHLNAMRP